MRSGAESQALSLPELSLSAFFERRWQSRYEALQDGRINGERLRAVFVQALLADKPTDEPIWLGLDSSGMQCLEAESSRDRGMIYVPNMPHATKPVSVGLPMPSGKGSMSTASGWWTPRGKACIFGRRLWWKSV